MTGLTFEQKTSFLAATARLSLVKPGVSAAAEKLAEDIKAYHALHPNEPINLFGHSNGTIVILLALDKIKGFKIDNVVLAASPFDVDNKLNLSILKTIVDEKANRVYFHFTRWDLVTSNRIVNGAKPIGVKGVINMDETEKIEGWSGLLFMHRSFDAHSKFTDCKDPVFDKYAKELGGGK